jgi:hypothetical protein
MFNSINQNLESSLKKSNTILNFNSYQDFKSEPGQKIKIESSYSAVFAMIKRISNQLTAECIS